jgi:transposase
MTTPQQGQRRSAALEARRFEAARLFTQGRSQAAVMRRLRVSRQTVHRSYHICRRRGRQGLKAAGRLGRKRRLDARQLVRVERALLRGPQRHGFHTDLWTLPRVATVIERLTGVLIWDGLGAHTSRAMRAYLARQRGWLHVERLPGYAPEPNPIEQVWGNVKVRELANVCASELTALRRPLHNGFARVRRQSDLAFAFLRHTGLQL